MLFLHCRFILFYFFFLFVFAFCGSALCNLFLTPLSAHVFCLFLVKLANDVSSMCPTSFSSLSLSRALSYSHSPRSVSKWQNTRNFWCGIVVRWKTGKAHARLLVKLSSLRGTGIAFLKMQVHSVCGSQWHSCSNCPSRPGPGHRRPGHLISHKMSLRWTHSSWGWDLHVEWAVDVLLCYTKVKLLKIVENSICLLNSFYELVI